MTESIYDHKLQARRQLYIERLYERAGRCNGLYTGLFLEHIDKLIRQDMEEVLGDD